jgi:uncharacterized DUF497 family protein
MPDIRRLIFDEENDAHIARHGITPEEVREVCESQPLVRRSRLNRLAVYGRTWPADIYSQFLSRLEWPNFVVTARDMSRAERRRCAGARRK